MAIGVQANTEDLGLDGVGVATERGFIRIGDDMSTNVPGIYAIGDVTGKLLLAHVASAQGVMAAEVIAGVESQPLDYVTMPRATYCLPQIASFGLTEQQAREQGYSVKIGKFPFQASGKAVAMAETTGMVKLVVDEKYGELLGSAPHRGGGDGDAGGAIHSQAPGGHYPGAWLDGPFPSHAVGSGEGGGPGRRRPGYPYLKPRMCIDAYVGEAKKASYSLHWPCTGPFRAVY